MPELCRLIVVVAKYLRPSLSVAELGREAIPCKDWPSATASGDCGLDKGSRPDPRLPPTTRQRNPFAELTGEPAPATNFIPLVFD